jgi:hypothetical protein
MDSISIKHSSHLDGRTASASKSPPCCKGVKGAMQELVRYKESWTGTKGSGHSEEQEQEGKALLLEEEGHVR